MAAEDENLAELMRQQGIVGFGQKPRRCRRAETVTRPPQDEPEAPAGQAPLLPPDREALECMDESWHKPGLEQQMKAARRKQECQDSCDLHGLTIEQAWQAVNDFLLAARQRQLRLLEIVHGYGRSRGHPSVLRGKVRGWLRESGEVNWFCQPKSNKGATLLCLRAGPQKQ